MENDSLRQLRKEKCLFKQVTRKKIGTCSVCKKIMNINEQALLVQSSFWDGIPKVIAVIHIDCKENFVFHYSKPSENK